MSEVKTCPVCKGRQTVPASFYLSQSGASIGDGSEVNCKSCGGQGYIIIYDSPLNYSWELYGSPYTGATIDR